MLYIFPLIRLQQCLGKGRGLCQSVSVHDVNLLTKCGQGSYWIKSINNC